MGDLCARCGELLKADEEPCDYHEWGCINDGTGACWCDTSQKLHRRCCLRCSRPLAGHECKRAS